MKKLIIVIALLLGSSALFAQTKTTTSSKYTSKWELNKNGDVSKMEVQVAFNQNHADKLSHVSFNISGDAINLTKITYSSNDSQGSVAVTKGNQDFMVVPGSYKFKFYHEKMGVKEFEFDIKSGSNATVNLSL